ncbi:MAG: hypothetical protein AAGI91_00975 [Bacteroidota bacterium]
MPVRTLALALFAAFLIAGCTTPRDSADTDGATSPAGGPPNVSTYVYGTWDYTMTALAGGDTVTGMLTIPEEGSGRFTMSDGTDAALDAPALSVTAPNFVLDGRVLADEPFGLSLAGSVAGDNMEAEANLDGMGAYRLTATRVQE